MRRRKKADDDSMRVKTARTAFGRFEALARKVVNVPKDDVDELEAQRVKRASRRPKG